MNLWEIKEEYLKVLDMTDDSDIDEQMITDTLESLEFALEDKVDNYSRFIKQLEADSLTIENRMTADQKKLKRKENLIDSLKERIKETMSQLDKVSIKTDLFDVKVVKNGGVQPIKINENDVTPEYIEMKPYVNSKKIREDLEKGKDLPFATLLERGTHLSIK